MTHEEIVKKAEEKYPLRLGIMGSGIEPPSNEGLYEQRVAYIKGYEDALASLPKIKAWVARDACGTLTLFSKEPYLNPRWCDVFQSDYGYQEVLEWGNKLTPEVLPEVGFADSPIEVELLIVKK